jgi:apolipoprotein N-acyltransferase
MVEFGLTLQALMWPSLIGMLALIRRASTWRTGEALAGVYLLVGPLAVCEAALWLHIPFAVAMQTLAPTLLFLTMFSAVIWPSGAVAVWIVRRINRRRARARASAAQTIGERP